MTLEQLALGWIILCGLLVNAYILGVAFDLLIDPYKTHKKDKTHKVFSQYGWVDCNICKRMK